LSSAVLLYGFSFLYGIGGTTNLTGLHDRLALVQASSAAGRADTAAMAGLMPMARLAAVLVFAALAFKIAAVPFHFYAPDVYQGTTAANAGLLAVAPKIAGIVVLVRIFVASMPAEEIKTLGWQLALAAALLSMTLGNVLALWQNNPRRLLAYSSIAHAGYMLIGLAVGLAQSSAAATHGAAAGDAIGGLDGIGALLFYLAAYAAATIGTFAALAYLSRDGRDVDSIDELAGLGRSRPGVAAAVAAFMFSLAGIPPLAGFWGKFTLFAGALKVYFDTGGAASDIAADVSDPSMPTWFLALAIAAALNAAIGAAYYLRIVGVMYFRAPVAASQPQGGWGALAATWVCAAVVLGIGLHPGPAVEQGRRASQAARATLEPLSRPHRLSDRSMALDATVP
jgi:NADH-quinone oxidoreductase subunit N